MANAQVVVWHEPKAGSAEREWEDGAGYDCGEPAAGAARCIVVDGATEAYDSIRWANQLVESFLGIAPSEGHGNSNGDDAPALTPAAMDEWFGRMQERWLKNAPAVFGNIFEERKFRDEGSFATLLGCTLSGLTGPLPQWSAVALGDTVLFHLRGAQVLAQFPVLAAGDFGIHPDGVFTQPAARGQMRSKLAFSGGALAPGDRLFIATDALAAWIVGSAPSHGEQVWRMLAEFDHPVVFRQFVDQQRREHVMTNDDVTLMRIDITAAPPDVLVVSQ